MKRKMKQVKDAAQKIRKTSYIREAALSLNPRRYGELMGASVLHAIRYIALILLLLFIAMSIISLPKLFNLPEQITTELEKFDQVDIDLSVSMSAPATFFAGDPQIVIDTTGAATQIGAEKLLITKEFLAYRPYGKVEQIAVADLKQVTDHKQQISKLLTWLFVLILPSLLLTTYVLFFIKYTVLILMMTLIVFAYNRLIKKDKGVRNSFLIAAYAATAMMLIEVLFLPFSSTYLLPFLQIGGMNFYGVSLILYLALALFGSLNAHRKKAKEDYVQVEKVEWDF